jgi:hypothetical protein
MQLSDERVIVRKVKTLNCKRLGALFVEVKGQTLLICFALHKQVLLEVLLVDQHLNFAVLGVSELAVLGRLSELLDLVVSTVVESNHDFVVVSQVCEADYLSLLDVVYKVSLDVQWNFLQI